MIIIKTKEEIEKLREGGRIVARILKETAARAVAGVTTAQLDRFVYETITQEGHYPAFLKYKPEGARKQFPASICISVNAEVVHGIPGARVLKEGDIVSLDLGLRYEGVFLDHAVTVGVGALSKEANALLRTTSEALYAGIEKARVGARIGDISHAIEKVGKAGRYGIVKGLSGHGVGRYIHEDPYIPNYGKPGKGEVIKAGMVIAIEPMFTLGSDTVVELSDGYTIRTGDNSLSAHFEHTVLITDEGPEILTLV
jgi:methionyl aminopeptidase